MAELINAEDHSREELDKLAVEAGLTDAADYKNKPAVAEAINRVNAGEDAATVNTELAPSAANKRPAIEPAKRSSKKIHAVNGGHPTQFDDTGNPVYDPEQV